MPHTLLFAVSASRRSRGTDWGRFATLACAALLVSTGCARPRPATPSPAVGDSARFDQFATRYLAGEFRPRGDRGDPHSWMKPEADRRGIEAAHRVLGELRAVDTTRLTTQQRIGWLLVEARAKRTLADTILRSAERVPGRYITLGGLYWRIAGDAEPTPEDWAAALETLENAPGALAIGRDRLVDPPPLWIQLAAATAEGFVGFLGGEFTERARAAPDSLRPGLAAAGRRVRDALNAYVAFLADTLEPGAAGSWAAGADYYDWVLREVNFLPYTAETMIAEGIGFMRPPRLRWIPWRGPLTPQTAGANSWRTCRPAIPSRGRFWMHIGASRAGFSLC